MSVVRDIKVIYTCYVTIQHQKPRTFSSSSENEKKTDSTKPKADALSYFKNHWENSGIRDRTCKDVNSLLVRVSYSELAITINALISLHWPLFVCYYFTLVEDIIVVNFAPYNEYFLTKGDVAFLVYMVHINLLPKIFFCATEVMVLATLCSRIFFLFFCLFFFFSQLT